MDAEDAKCEVCIISSNASLLCFILQLIADDSEFHISSPPLSPELKISLFLKLVISLKYLIQLNVLSAGVNTVCSAR